MADKNAANVDVSVVASKPKPIPEKIEPVLSPTDDLRLLLADLVLAQRAVELAITGRGSSGIESVSARSALERVRKYITTHKVELVSEEETT